MIYFNFTMHKKLFVTCLVHTCKLHYKNDTITFIIKRTESNVILKYLLFSRFSSKIKNRIIFYCKYVKWWVFWWPCTTLNSFCIFVVHYPRNNIRLGILLLKVWKVKDDIEFYQILWCLHIFKKKQLFVICLKEFYCNLSFLNIDFI